MKKIIKIRAVSMSLICLGLSTSSQVAMAKNANATEEVQERKDNDKFPIGCTPVGYDLNLKIVSLYPGKVGALQSMYFFFNKLNQPVSLYQMRDKDSEYSMRFNHTVPASSWSVLATGEHEVKFICTLGDGKKSYGQIIDCADTLKVCEYVNVKFGLNNKGNFWIVDSSSRNGAVNGVVHYGIIPGV